MPLPDETCALPVGTKLHRPPIVEAVLDFECDLPPAQDLAALEPEARERFRACYPKLRQMRFQEHEIRAGPEGPPSHAVTCERLQSLQFLTADECQLVQVRASGFSFNRLKPYDALDRYLPEIERCWGIYRELANPMRVNLVRLRYINRILLPLSDGRLDLKEYLQVCPALPDPGLSFRGFVNQHVAVEPSTGHEATLVLATQPPVGAELPMIFDNGVTARCALPPDDWAGLLAVLGALRGLKNRIFWNTLTPKCMTAFL